MIKLFHIIHGTDSSSTIPHCKMIWLSQFCVYGIHLEYIKVETLILHACQDP